MEPPLRLAASPVTWGVDFADTPSNPAWELVLDEIQQSGVGALELGPVGYLPEDPELLREALDRRGLTSVGSFVFDDLHDPFQRARVLDVTERACAAIAAAGGGVFVIIDRPDTVRVATAGRPGSAPRMAAGEWAAMLAVIGEVADRARVHGLRPVVHPHAGGYLEFEDEIERLVGDTDLDLCLDTGHLTYARVDPAEAITRFADRLGHVHLKDIDGGVLAQVDAEGLDFWTAIKRGIFCPIGDGIVDVRGVVEALSHAGYDGFATIEQDRVAGTGTPLDDLRRSLGVVAAAQSA